MNEVGSIALPDWDGELVADRDLLARAADLLRAQIHCEPTPAITPISLEVAP